jgi:hypothetical protein
MKKIFRRGGLLPLLPPAVEEEHEALGILCRLPADVRAIAMRMLRSLEPDTLPIQPAPARAESGAPPEADERDHLDSYVEISAHLWDKVPGCRELLHPRQINQALGFDLLPVPDWEWRLDLEFDVVRIIGEILT